MSLIVMCLLFMASGMLLGIAFMSDGTQWLLDLLAASATAIALLLLHYELQYEKED